MNASKYIGYSQKNSEVSCCLKNTYFASIEIFNSLPHKRTSLLLFREHTRNTNSESRQWGGGQRKNHGTTAAQHTQQNNSCTIYPTEG